MAKRKKNPKHPTHSNVVWNNVVEFALLKLPPEEPVLVYVIDAATRSVFCEALGFSMEEREEVGGMIVRALNG